MKCKIMQIEESDIFRGGKQPLILLHEKFLQFDWLRAVVFHVDLKYLNDCAIKNLLRVVV